MEPGRVFVQICDIGLDSALVVELEFLADSLVKQIDPDAAVKESHLAEPLLYFFEVESGHCEYFRIRLEGDLRAVLVGFADLLERSIGVAAVVNLPVDSSLTLDFKLEPLGKGVYAADADAVKTARDLVCVVVELAAGMKDRHDDFSRRAVFLLVHIDRDTSAVILDCYAFVDMDINGDLVAVTGKSLVDTVVNDLVDHVVETASVVSVADIHTRAFTNRLQTLKYLNTLGTVLLFGLSFR